MKDLQDALKTLNLVDFVGDATTQRSLRRDYLRSLFSLLERVKDVELLHAVCDRVELILGFWTEANTRLLTERPESKAAGEALRNGWRESLSPELREMIDEALRETKGP